MIKLVLILLLIAFVVTTIMLATNGKDKDGGPS
jgi:hypothetical protein